MKKIVISTLLVWVGVFTLDTVGLGQEIAILFTSNSNGKIENCECPDLPYGALEKRAQFLETYRQKRPDALILDNGDNFVNYTDQRRFPVILEGFQLISYDVINLGDQDLAFAPPEYFELPGIVKSQGKPIRIIKGGTTFSILPVMHTMARRFYPDGTFDETKFSDPVADIKQWLQDTEQSGEFTILLSHSGYDQDVGFANDFPEIDLIIGGHSQTIIDSLNVINGLPVLQAGGNAQFVGELLFSGERGEFQPVSYTLHPLTLDMPNHPRMVELLGRYHDAP